MTNLQIEALATEKSAIELVLEVTEDVTELGKALDLADAFDKRVSALWQIESNIYMKAARRWRVMLRAGGKLLFPLYSTIIIAKFMPIIPLAYDLLLNVVRLCFDSKCCADRTRRAGMTLAMNTAGKKLLIYCIVMLSVLISGFTFLFSAHLVISSSLFSTF